MKYQRNLSNSRTRLRTSDVCLVFSCFNRIAILDEISPVNNSLSKVHPLPVQ